MFFDGGSSSKKAVDLRGKSKKEDRSALIARAEKAREDRERQRRRLRAATQMQASFRAQLDLRRAMALERRLFDDACESRRAAIIADGAAFAALTSSLLFFHQLREPADAGRRRTLLQMLLESAESSSVATNVCAQLCSSAEGAVRWQHQSRCARPTIRISQRVLRARARRS